MTRLARKFTIPESDVMLTLWVIFSSSPPHHCTDSEVLITTEGDTKAKRLDFETWSYKSDWGPLCSLQEYVILIFQNKNLKKTKVSELTQPLSLWLSRHALSSPQASGRLFISCMRTICPNGSAASALWMESRFCYFLAWEPYAQMFGLLVPCGCNHVPVFFLLEKHIPKWMDWYGPVDGITRLVIFFLRTICSNLSATSSLWI